MEMERGKRIDASLPETMIQHIQSFLSGKEAARTTILSKSWYNAWLTRPSLAFDQRDFRNRGGRSSGVRLSEFAMKTMGRYRHLNLKFERLRLQTRSTTTERDEQFTPKLIVEALEIGATDLNLESLPPSAYTLPQEVLQSDTLLRLSVKGCEIDGKFKCSMLRSLSLDSVCWQSRHMVTGMISCCVSIEELSISNSSISDSGRLILSKEDLPKLHKLESLHLEKVDIDHSFFLDFDSRFPCLKDLSLVRCQHDDRISKTVHILSTSLRCIRIVQHKVMNGKFTAPNLVLFSYTGMVTPTLSLEARECESHISLKTNRWRNCAWFLRLRKLLAWLRPSKINLSISGKDYIQKGDLGVGKAVVVVENVTFDAKSTLSCALLVMLFQICRPKFVRSEGYPYFQYERLKSLMQEVNTPDHDVFGRFGLKEVHMQVYEESLTQWRTLLLEGPVEAALIDRANKQNFRLELKW